MKQASVLVAGAVLLSVAMAYGQDGMSDNAVGYALVSVDRDAFGLLAYAFDPLSGGEPNPSTVLGTNLPVGTSAYIWDDAGQQYNFETLSSIKGVGTAWNPDTNLLERGKGFWLKIPASAPLSQYLIQFIGEVPNSQTAPQTQRPIWEAFNLIGYPYPVQVVWTNVELSQIATVGDSLYTFTGGGYSFNTLVSTKGVGEAWSVPTQQLTIGTGYWYSHVTGGGTLQWIENKPYTWP